MITIKTAPPTVSEENSTLDFLNISSDRNHFRATLDNHGNITLDTGEYIPACDVQLVFMHESSDHICID